MELDLRSVTVALLFALRECCKAVVGRTRILKLLYLVDRECRNQLIGSALMLRGFVMVRTVLEGGSGCS